MQRGLVGAGPVEEEGKAASVGKLGRGAEPAVLGVEGRLGGVDDFPDDGQVKAIVGLGGGCLGVRAEQGSPLADAVFVVTVGIGELLEQQGEFMGRGVGAA